MGGALASYVTAFIDDVDAELSGLSSDDHRRECWIEASDLVSAILDSDGRLTQAELDAWLDDLGTAPRAAGVDHLDPAARLRPDRRQASAGWTRPSTMFDLLLRADARDGERRANRYYDVALRLAHAVGGDRSRAVP